MLASLFLGLALALPSVASSATPAASSLVVHLTSGRFNGVAAGAPTDVEKWLGVPFAQSPVGSLRFKAPVAITDPSSTVKNASQFGNACPQVPSDSLGAPISEDCLFLNVSPLAYILLDRHYLTSIQVFRPAGTKSDAKLPVLVWFYVSLRSVLRQQLPFLIVTFM